MSRTDENPNARSDSATYRSWCAMKTRCFNPTDDAYQHYGGRGITVCARWRDREALETIDSICERTLMRGDGAYGLGQIQAVAEALLRDPGGER